MRQSVPRYVSDVSAFITHKECSYSVQINGLTRLSWPHPEWWAIAMSVVAWLTILAQPVFAASQMSHGHSDHTMLNALPANGSVASTTRVFSWALMIMAMMFPMVLDSIRTIAARSLWRRRHRAIVEFLAGYLALWMLFGIAVSGVISLLQVQVQSTLIAALGFGVAVLWQVMPAKRRALLACHRTLPIAPTGWRADRDCLRSGWVVGTSCVISCWALMLACMLSDHSIPAMLGATAIAWTERNRARPNQRLLCSVLVLLAVAHMIVP